MAINIKNITAAVDVDDDLAGAVLKTAAELSELFHAMLHVVDVITPIKGFETLHAMDATMHNVEAHQKAEAERLEQLSSLVSKVVPSAKSIVVHGNAGEAVADYAKQNHTDLLIIGSHQKGWWKTLASGAASPELVRDAPCAVYVVTREAARNMLPST